MLILVGCEFSGIVRDAFRARGHDAWSCDLLPSERPGPHLTGDILEVAGSQPWDMMVAFPPCTALCCTGNRWYAGTPARLEAVGFVRSLMDTGIPRWAIENPVGVLSTHIRTPDQTVQPWQFGHGETKATCLWLQGLPLLNPTTALPGRRPRSWLAPGGSEQWKTRSRTLPGLADAMAEQWGY